jgi:hypothetical protein
MPAKTDHTQKKPHSLPGHSSRARAVAQAVEEPLLAARAARAVASPHAASAADLLSLQRVAGNQAVNRLFECGNTSVIRPVQRDLTLFTTNTPDIHRLDQSLPYVGPLMSYLNPVNQAVRLVLPGLSRDQKSLLDGIFSASLATSLIRLNRNSVLATGNCYRTTGNIINMPGDTIADSHLIHEAAHTWQSQNTLFGVGYAVSALRAQAIAQVIGGDWQRAYNYKDVERLRIPWRYWNAEQQAHWIEDNRRLPSFESSGLEY